MSDAPRENFQDLITDFDNAMLVTATPTGQLRARPMRIANIQQDASMWFATGLRSGKTEEIQNDSHVAVVFQGGGKYVSMSGIASVSRNPAKIDELWNEAWKVWFPEGKSDPSLALLHVSPQEGEYWDNSGASGLQYLFEAGKAYLQGEKPEISDEINEKVKL